MSKGKMTLTALLLVCLSALATAEEPVLKHSVNIGISGASLVNNFYFLDGYKNVNELEKTEPGSLEYIFENYYGETFKTCQWCLNAGFLEDRQFSVGAGLAGEASLRREYDSVSGKPLAYRSDMAFSIYARGRYNFLTRNKVRLYCALDAGVTVGSKKGVKKAIPCAQAVPFGLTYGKKAYLFGEIGIGTRYMGGSIGAGFRF